MRERYPSYSSFRLETDLLQSLNFSDSLDYEIIEKKSELVKLEHQKELLKKEGLING
jgi:hypothetical protein